MFYDMQGKPIGMQEFSKLYSDHKRIVQQTHCGPFGFFLVSTVLVGLDHNYGSDGPPIIFETVAFSGFRFCLRWPSYYSKRYDAMFIMSPFWTYGNGFDEDRYATLAQAKGGHLDFVEKYSGWRGFKAMLRVLWSGS